MEWRDLKDEIEHYNTLSTEEIKQIVQSGVDTEFWKWFRSRIAMVLATAEASLLEGEEIGLDDTLKAVRMRAIYKQTKQLFNTPEYVLAYQPPPLAPKTPESVKIGRT